MIKSIAIISLILIAYVALAYFNEQAGQLSVSYVVDGDTFVTTNDETVRVWGIDAPEEDQPFYQTATITLESLIEDSFLACNFITKGKYRRDIMRCYNADGQDIGALMIQKGMAKDYNSVSGGYYMRDEIQAQKRQLGIWKK